MISNENIIQRISITTYILNQMISNRLSKSKCIALLSTSGEICVIGCNLY